MEPEKTISKAVLKSNYFTRPSEFLLSSKERNIHAEEDDHNNMNSIFLKNPEHLQSKPDVDSIKMFVGQIPHTFTESDLLQMFEKYGKVYDLRVLKDKNTGKSKGCCFVTFFTRHDALRAQTALHNIKFLPGMHHPIQMKPADSENRIDRKLFIGMLSKLYTENDIRDLFSPYGTIEECTVLRDTCGKSKGCAFVTYLTRQSAQNAVKSMHHCHIFDDCSSPMVVKFADTQKDKEMRKMQIIQSEFCEQGHISNFLKQISLESLSSFVASNSLLQQLHLNGYFNTDQHTSHLNLPERQNLNWGVPLTGSYVKNNLNNNFIKQNGLPRFSSLPINDSVLWNSALMFHINSTTNGGLHPVGYPETMFTPITSPPYNAIGRKHSFDKYGLIQKQIEGPDGANLFIYHLPQEFTDLKLAELFIPFGKVISAKVFIDKITKSSKCFGFVSYDNVISAKSAIQNLNGYHILGKKLKVEVKQKRMH